jgi:23S rRNA (uracil1939-C5)-methyltransferase
MSKRHRKKLPSEAVKATISHLSHEGRGITEIDGKTTFIFGALPGESVSFKYTKRRKQFDEGQAQDVHTAAIERTTPPCQYFGICGGCSLQHMKHASQISHKQASVLALLKQIADVSPDEILPAITAETLGYRRKARIGVKYVAKKEKVLVGFREKNSPYITNMDQCHTLHPSIGHAIEPLSQLLMTLESKDKIPQLEVAVGDNATAIILRHLAPLSDADKKILMDFFKQQQWHLYLQPKGTDSIHRIYPDEGEERLSYNLPNHQLTLQFHPAQFIQINHSINHQMIDRAIELLNIQKQDRILDLFCGIGNFSLPIAKHCKTLIGVEGDDSAVTQAKANAIDNQLSNTEFYTANLFEDIKHQAWAKQPFDKILLDPPRCGAKEILEQIKQWQPKRIVYVSCHPATLARDAEILTKYGYHLTMTGIMDMFPHTQHVEVMALFENERII